jgi:transcriptional regulator with XRE-family HTH domain
LETLVYYLKLPISHFWGKEVISDDHSPVESLDLPRLISLRQRMIGALMRQERTNANISIKQLASQTGISSPRLNSYEMGERPISVPELESIVTVLGARMDTFFDQSGPVGKWMSEQRAMQKFVELSDEMQDFICQPVNRPYLELAMKLSTMSRERLRSVAEGLLDITL